MDLNIGTTCFKRRKSLGEKEIIGLNLKFGGRTLEVTEES